MALLLRHRHRPLCQCPRVFSISTRRHISLQLDRNDTDVVADTVPAYPYGPARWYKQSDLGLYGGQRIQFGNNVGPKSKTKTRRRWHVSVFQKRLWSKALNRLVQVRVSVRTQRTIDKLGGLDEYLLGEKEARIKALGMSGWWLRWAIMRTDGVRRRFAEERRKLGLPESEEEVERKMRRREVAGAESEVKGLRKAFEALALETEDEANATAQVSDASAEEQSQDAISELGAEEFEDLGSEEDPIEVEAAAENDQFIDEALQQPPTDDAFQIVHTPDLPPLKFRVGPGQHLVLTPNGWRRTREGPWYRENLAKDDLRAKRANWVDEKMEKFEEELDRQQELLRQKQKQQRRARYQRSLSTASSSALDENGNAREKTEDVGQESDLSLLLENVQSKEERAALLRQARREFVAEREAWVERGYERKVRRKEEGQMARDIEKGTKRAAEEGGRRARRERLVEP